MMNKRLKDRWVKALRSGKYQQGQSYLRVEEFDNEGNEVSSYCCLGVLADLKGYELTGCDATLSDLKEHEEANKLLGPWNAKEDDVHFNSANPKTHTTLQRKLAGKNDSGWSFKRIATWIEKNVPTGRQAK
jgi:hypothetical protein